MTTTPPSSGPNLGPAQFDPSTLSTTAEPPPKPPADAKKDGPPAKQHRARSYIIRALLALAVIGGVVWYLHHRSATADKETKAKAAAAAGRVTPVVVAPVEKKDVPVWLEGLGTITANLQVTVHPQVDGRLDEVGFKEGAEVKKGQVLAQIDPRPFLVQLHTAEGALERDQAQLKDAQSNLDRYRTLSKQKLVSDQQVSDQAALVGQAQGAVRIDEASIESAHLALDYAAIKAPFDGVTGVRLVDPGNMVHATDPTGIVILTQLDPIAVIFTLPEDELPRIALAREKGDLPVQAQSRDGKLQLGEGKLAVLDNQINSSTATLRLKAFLPNPDHKLWPNQFVKTRMLVDVAHDALVVPAVAVQQGPQGPFIYTASAGPDAVVTQRPVTISATVGESAIVSKSDLQPGELVVIEGQNQLRPGAKVSARKQGEAPASQPTSRPAGGGAGEAAGDGKKKGGGGGRKHAEAAPLDAGAADPSPGAAGGEAAR